MRLRIYLDIETTGFSANAADLTVIGLSIEEGEKNNFKQLVGDGISISELKKLIKKGCTLYTYNGSRFDLPFIHNKLGIDLAKHCLHKDLMLDCWKKNLYGGLKSVERQLGLQRKLKDVDGYMAVILWNKYKKYGDKEALQKLLIYNKEDVINLGKLRKKLGVG